MGMTTPRFLAILAFYLLLLHSGVRAPQLEPDPTCAEAALQGEERESAVSMQARGEDLALAPDRSARAG